MARRYPREFRDRIREVTTRQNPFDKDLERIEAAESVAVFARKLRGQYPDVDYFPYGMRGYIDLMYDAVERYEKAYELPTTRDGVDDR